MNIYYRNALRAAAAFDAQPLTPGFILSDIYDPFLSRQLDFTSGEVSVTASWGVGNYIDSIATAGCRFTQGRVKLFNQGDIALERDLYAVYGHGGGVDVFPLYGMYHCTGMELTLYGPEALQIGYLFAGLRTALPRFRPGPDTALDVTGEAGKTKNGQAYGLRWPSLHTFSASFDRVGMGARRVMEDYINAVQYVIPHIIEPYSPEKYPPLYAALTKAGGFKKRDEAGFYFDTAMSWEESR
jgi:hypothetical protein